MTQATPKVVLTKIDDLKPHPRNYRKHPEDQLQHIIASIREHGYYRNVVAAKDGTILAGHGVVEASRKMGKKLVPVIRLRIGPDDPRALKVLTSDNEISNLAEVDDRALTEMLKELGDIDQLLGTGFDEATLAALAFVTRPESEIQSKSHAAGWVGMPEYTQGEEDEYRVVVTCSSKEDREKFMEMIGAKVVNKKTERVFSIYWPERKKQDLASVRFTSQKTDEKAEHPKYKHVQGGGVPGGHNVILNAEGKPFIPPTREFSSIPLRTTDVVVDIGAYCGTYALRCARFPVKKVIAYEPTPSTFEILAKNKRPPNLELVNAAVSGDSRKEVELHISNGIGVTNSTTPKRGSTSISVPSVSYKKAVQGASIVKIDVEGAEYDFPIVQPSLRAVIIDFHPIGSDWKEKAEKIIEDLKEAGFRAVISPDFSNGWTRAGSFIRDLETSGENHPMTRGKVCCGCGVALAKSKAKPSLCPSCWKEFSARHRLTYSLGEAK